jgi:hypothetical protein
MTLDDAGGFGEWYGLKETERRRMAFKEIERCSKALKEAQWSGAKGVSGNATQ